MQSYREIRCINLSEYAIREIKIWAFKRDAIPPNLRCEFMHMQREEHSLRRLKEFLLDAAGGNIALVLPWGTLVPLPSSTRAIAYDSPKVHMNTCRVHAVHRLTRECISWVRQYTALRVDRLCESQSVHIHAWHICIASTVRCVNRVSRNRAAIQKKYGACHVNLYQI